MWVLLAIGEGLYNAFTIELPGTDATYNPLGPSYWSAAFNPGSSPGSLNVLKKPMQVHHIATNKGRRAADFERIFKQAGMSLDDDLNKVSIPHSGRHPRDYHAFVYKRLNDAVGNLTGNEAKAALTEELKRLKAFIKKNPHFVYNSAGGRPTTWRGMREQSVTMSRGRYRIRN